MLIPSQLDPIKALVGKHYMSVCVQYRPYRRADGEWDVSDTRFTGDFGL
jgi:hypothetical protein